MRSIWTSDHSVSHAPKRRRAAARLRQAVARGDVPQADDTLHQPHPRRQLLDALLAPVLRSLNLHHLLARFEGNLNRPSPGECRDPPTQLGMHIRGEQILVLELALRVADQQHENRQQPAHLGPERLKRDHLQRACHPVGRGLDRLPSPRPLSATVAIGLLHSLLRVGKTRALSRLPSALALGLLGHDRIVKRRIGTHHADIGHPRVEIPQQVARRIGPIADENQLSIGEPSQDLLEHFLGQRGFARVVLARKMQSSVDRQAVNLVGLGKGNCQPHYNPVVAAGGRDPFGGRGHGIAEPTQAVDMPAPFVQQGVVDHQVQQPVRIEPDDDRRGHLLGQVAYQPSRTAEEVVEAVERMPLLAGERRIGLDRLEHSVLGSPAQAHHPTEQHLDVRLERRLREHRQQALQNRVERGYARKHGRGPPCPFARF